MNVKAGRTRTERPMDVKTGRTRTKILTRRASFPDNRIQSDVCVCVCVCVCGGVGWEVIIRTVILAKLIIELVNEPHTH